MSLDQRTRYYAILHAELQAVHLPSLAILSFEFRNIEELRHALDTFQCLRAFRSLSGQPVAYRLLVDRRGFEGYSFLDMLPKDKDWRWAGIDTASMQPTGE